MVVPGWSNPLSDINKFNLKDIRWQEAHWLCPSCKRDPVFQPDLLEWVVENPNDNYEAHTYYITPVTACKVLVPSYVVRTSTEFNSEAEWRNQVLGEASENEESQIVVTDLEKAKQTGDFTATDTPHYFGADIGQLCHIVISRFHSGVFLAVHRETCPLSQFLETRNRLIKEHRCITSVQDAQPETALITGITDYDPNAYGCIFVSTKTPEMYTVVQKVETPEEGKLNLRLVKANKTAAFDKLLTFIKAGNFVFKSASDDGKFISHVLSMKRTLVHKDGYEPAYTWQKTDGEDHYMHALLYSFLACTLRGTANEVIRSGNTSLVRSMKVRV
jgi:hypothetical protein